MPAMSEQQEATITVPLEMAKFMLDRAITHYNDAVRGGMPKSADFWDGYIRGIRNLINAGERRGG